MIIITLPNKTKKSRCTSKGGREGEDSKIETEAGKQGATHTRAHRHVVPKKDIY